MNTDPTTIDFSNDLISNNFTASATTTIEYSSSGATVSNLLSGDTIDVNGGYVSAKLHNSGTVLKVTGSSSNGALLINSDNKFELNLSNATLSNPNGTAINIQNGHCFVVVDGTNTLADASSSSYSDDYSVNGKSVFHSEDKLRFSGSGTLNITASNVAEKHALSSDDWIVVDGATISATSGSSAGQGIKVNDGFYLKSGAVTVSASGASKKGINSEAFIYVAGGTLNATVSGTYAYDEDDSEYKSAVALKGDGYVTVSGGTVTAKSSGAGGKAVSSDFIFNMKGGSLTATSTGSDTNSTIDKAPKAIKADGGILIEGGTITATSSNHEGIESKSILKITDGTVYAQAKDDAINSAGDMTISGGYFCAYSTGNDGIDANGNIYLKGGVIYAIGSGTPEVGIDANTEGGYTLYVQGGTIVAIGGLENGSSLSQSCYQASWSKNTWYALYNGDDLAFAFKTPSSGGTGMVVSTVSTPSLKSGVTASGTDILNNMAKASATVSGGSSVSLSSYTGGMGGMGGGGWR